MTKNNEIRTISTSLRAAKGANNWTIFGHAISYNYLSQPLGGFREVIAPGAFAAHLRTNPDVPCLFQHQPEKILGRTLNGTLQLMDGPTSLDFRCQLDERQQWAKDLWHAIDRRDIDSMSFGFVLDGDGADAWDTGMDERGNSFNRRTVRRARLMDVSPVVGAAYVNKDGAANVAARCADYMLGRNAISTAIPSDSALRAKSLQVAKQIWAPERAELARMDKRFACDRLKARLERLERELREFSLEDN